VEENRGGNGERMVRFYQPRRHGGHGVRREFLRWFVFLDRIAGFFRMNRIGV
jgi:hypothetical protein